MKMMTSGRNLPKSKQSPLAGFLWMKVLACTWSVIQVVGIAKAEMAGGNVLWLL
jgi:hypothetical protein